MNNFNPLKILIACETSGTVRDAFLEQGHDAWSCDILPSDTPSNRHIQDDVRNVLTYDAWDMLMVAHPPCTRLCNSGVRWLSKPPTQLTPAHHTAAEIEAYSHMTEKERLDFMWEKLDEGAELFSDLWNADIPMVAVENPVMHKHAKSRIKNYEPFAQSVHPWQFETNEDGPDNVKKRTCLWLRGLPPLKPTGNLDGSTARPEIHHASPGPDRWKQRSKFFTGIAKAMADQWGHLATQTAGVYQ